MLQNFSWKSVSKGPAYFSRSDPAVHGVRPLKHNSNKKIHERNYPALLAGQDIATVTALNKLVGYPRFQKKRKGKPVQSPDSLLTPFDSFCPFPMLKKEKRFAPIAE